MTPNMRNIGIGFGWTKNRALLKLEPGRAVWEDLYPAGSILKITNIQVQAPCTLISLFNIKKMLEFKITVSLFFKIKITLGKHESVSIQF